MWEEPAWIDEYHICEGILSEIDDISKIVFKKVE